MVLRVDEALGVINDLHRGITVHGQLDAVLGGNGILDDLLRAVGVDEHRHGAGSHVGNGDLDLGLAGISGQLHLHHGGGVGIAGSLDLHGSLDGLAVALGILDGLIAQLGFRLGLAVLVGLYRAGGAVSGLVLGNGAAVLLGFRLGHGAVLAGGGLDLGAVGLRFSLNLGAVGLGDSLGLASAGRGLAGTAGAAAGGAAAGGTAAALCSHGHSAVSRFLAVNRRNSNLRSSFCNCGHLAVFIDRSDRWIIAAPRNTFVGSITGQNRSC